MTLLFKAFKLAILTVAVLVLGQMPVNNRRVCDHVADIMAMAKFDLRKPLAWVGKNFDFTKAERASRKLKAPNLHDLNDSEIIDYDREALSGLLKQARK